MQTVSKKSFAKRMIAILLVAMMMLGVLVISANAEVPDGYFYFGYSCGYNDCGAFWKHDQRYNEYMNSQERVYTEYAGFGVCCPNDKP